MGSWNYGIIESYFCIYCYYLFGRLCYLGYFLNLETKKMRSLKEINSGQSDSYHSWSTNGRWIVFGSRRMDGTFTRPYLCYFDVEGNVHTPFLLPQKDPQHYYFSFKSYNIPEFITGKVTVSPYKLSKIAKGKTIDAK